MALSRRFSRLTTSLLGLHTQFIPLMGVLVAAGWIAIAGSQIAPFDSGHLSAEHFTLNGEVPARVGLRALAHFGPSSGQTECPFTNPLLPFDAPPGERVQLFSFKVPLSYQLSGCRMDLTRVDFETEALYGTDYLQRSISSSGALAVHTASHRNVRSFPDSGEKEWRGLCSWRAGASGHGVEPEWRFTCHAADQDWQLRGDREHPVRPGGAVSLEDLEGKTIYMNFRVLEAL